VLRAAGVSLFQGYMLAKLMLMTLPEVFMLTLSQAAKKTAGCWSRR